MRVLVIDEALPWPPDTGKRIRTWELMRRLAPDFDIRFLYHEESETDPEGIRRFTEAGMSLRAIPRARLKKRGGRFAWDLLRNVPRRDPYIVMVHTTDAMIEAIREEVRDGAALVHIEQTPLWGNVPPGVEAPTCLAAHNVESQIWERYAENEPHPGKRAYIRLQLKKLKRLEKRALTEADAVIAVSQDDARRIRDWSGSDAVTVVPNGVDVVTCAPQRDVAVVPDSTLFVGSLDYRPNLDGVTWYLKEVWPRIREACPEATFEIVGRSPPPWLAKTVAGLQGVTLHGGVPDVRPFVAAAAVSVVPLRIGGGSRLKICEALSMERPLVSTTIGAEGLDLGDGLSRGDSPAEFAQAVVHAFRDAAAARAMAVRGRERVLERYSWDPIAPLQAEAWRAAVGTG